MMQAFAVVTHAQEKKDTCIYEQTTEQVQLRKDNSEEEEEEEERGRAKGMTTSFDENRDVLLVWEVPELGGDDGYVLACGECVLGGEKGRDVEAVVLGHLRAIHTDDFTGAVLDDLEAVEEGRRLGTNGSTIEGEFTLGRPAVALIPCHGNERSPGSRLTSLIEKMDLQHISVRSLIVNEELHSYLDHRHFYQDTKQQYSYPKFTHSKRKKKNQQNCRISTAKKKKNLEGGKEVSIMME